MKTTLRYFDETPIIINNKALPKSILMNVISTLSWECDLNKVVNRAICDVNKDMVVRTQYRQPILHPTTVLTKVICLLTCYTPIHNLEMVCKQKYITIGDHNYPLYEFVIFPENEDAKQLWIDVLYKKI